MQISPESKAIIDKLNNSEIIQAGKDCIGPLDAITKDVLKTIIDNYIILNGQSGDSRVKAFVGYNQKIIKENKEKLQTTEIVSIQENISSKVSQKQNKWYLHKIKCHSIRGLASHGETVEFSFEGKSNLMYGPNGSGKSSLLGAIVWAFTGVTITDASERTEDAEIYQKATESKKGSKIRIWPTIATLPEGGNIKSINPNSWVEIELKTKDANSVIYLKRSLEKGLEVSSNSDKWELCKNLNDYGIAPLDMQISLMAPNILSRNTLDDASDVMRILSLILGYDSLSDIGELASNIATNRTAYSNKIGKEINTLWETFHSRFHNLLVSLEDGNAIKESLRSQVSKDKPSEENLNKIDSAIQAEITAANKSVAEMLGITDENISIAGLADKLIETIAIFEKGVSQIFPSFLALKYDGSLLSGKTINEVEKEFLAFRDSAKDRIRKRIDWWKKEKGSRLALKLRAAKEYDIERKECPVCDQSIDGLPIKDELEYLKGKSDELKREITDFFKDLYEELNRIIPLQIQKLSEINPSGRILADWGKLKTTIDKRLEGIIAKYDPKISEIYNGISEGEIENISLFDDTDQEVLSAAKEFLKNFRDSLISIHYLKWGTANYENIQTQLENLLTSSNASSLLTELGKSKDKALNIKPLGTIKTNLAQLITDRKIIAAKEAEYQLLAKLEDPLKQIKQLSKYALIKTEEIFRIIKIKADNNWKLLYPENPMGLVPSNLVLERGKKIESLLAIKDIEVEGKHFANAGLQRSIALSFLCALLDKYKGALAFVVFDDPILSLDEDHRESWVRRIVSPMMKEYQVILATHQQYFLNNCNQDFIREQIVKINPRTRKKRISFEPGYLLDRAEYYLTENWEYVPILLYQYVEYLLETLDSYSPDPFFDKENLTNSFKNYKALSSPNPLCGPRKSKIINYLGDQKVSVAFQARHLPTKEQVTEPMVKESHKLLKELDKTFKQELDDLKELLAKQLRRNTLEKTAEKPILQNIGSNKYIKFQVIGKAAARQSSWVVDSSEQQVPFSVLISTCVHVTGHSFDPVVRCGQCVLLAQENNCPIDGDLVAGQLDEETRCLRRIAFDGDYAFLYSINPLKTIPPIRVEKPQLVSHKVVGVIYEPCRQCTHDYTNEASEWQLCPKMDLSYFDKMKMISVEGDSLEPIARKGQKVLVGNSYSPKQCPIEKGGLAVVETDDDTKGNIIKRIYSDGDKWIFISPNPLIPYQPDIVPVEKIKKIWPLCGVIFESIEKE